MIQWISSEIINMITSMSKSTLKRLILGLRYTRLKKCIEMQLTDKILNKYGNEIFFNDLDAFLQNNKILRNCIVVCETHNSSTKKGPLQFIEETVSEFLLRYCAPLSNL